MRVLQRVRLIKFALEFTTSEYPEEAEELVCLHSKVHVGLEGIKVGSGSAVAIAYSTTGCAVCDAVSGV